MTVSARFAFTANFEVLEAVAKAMEQIAAFAEPAAKGIGALNRAFRSGARSAETYTATNEAVERSLGGIAARADAAAASMRRVATATTAASRAGGGGAFGSFLGGVGKGVAIAGLATEIVGVRGAANLQDASIQTAIALGRSNQFVAQNLVPLAMQMSMSTAQSVTSSMGILRTMATSGLNDPAQLRALAMPIARFADTQYLGKNHVPFEQSAAMASSLAHQLNLRTADQMAPFLNTLFKLSNDMPDSLKTAATQIKYYGANYVAAGVDPSTILQMQATADRLGYGGGKSGTGLNMLLRNLQAPSSAKMAAAQGALGLLNADGTNKFIDQRTGVVSPDAFFSFLNARADAARKSGTVGAFRTNMKHAFDTNAGLIAGAFSSDAGIQQRENVRKTMQRVEDLQKAQADLIGSLNNQTKLLTSNFQTLATLLAGPLLGPLTKIVGGLAQTTGSAGMYLQNHPAVQNIAAGALAVVAAAGAYYAFKVLGGVGIFAHTAAKIGGERFGIGGWIHRSFNGGETAKNGANMLKDVFGGVNIVKDVTRFKGALGDLGYVLRNVGTKGGVSLLGEAIAKLGLRFIPVVGWITLAIDALKLFVTHSTDINYAIGRATQWMKDIGWPSFSKAVVSGWNSAWDYLKKVLPEIGGFIWDSIRNSFTGGPAGQQNGIQAAAKHGLSWLIDWYSKMEAANKAAQAAGARAQAAVDHPSRQKTRDERHQHTTIVLHGEAAVREVRKHLPPRGTNALQQGAPVSFHFPAAQTTGLGFGV